MVRALFGSVQVLLAIAFSMPGCGKKEAGRPAPGPERVAVAGPRLGQPAPELEGPGLDGSLMKLSDQRGKVVVLCFWGHF
jgi:hypothetical protein